MIKIIKYSLFDLMRSKWLYFYTSFFLFSSIALLFLNSDLNAAITNLMLLTIFVCPLISIIFGTMYFYNSKEFILILLAQPIKRKNIILGQYISLTFSLSMAYLLGVFLPLSIYGVLISKLIFNFIILIISGFLLTFIFSGLAMLISILVENKVKGLGLILFIWLLLTFVYDAIFLILLFYFSDYPLENFAIIATIFNPIDLSRILVTIKLDSAMLMGYTGAIFSQFFGKLFGTIISILMLLIWTIIPLLLSIKSFNSKDF